MYLILFIAPGSRDLFICPYLGVSATFKNLLKLLCEMYHTMHVSKIYVLSSMYAFSTTLIQIPLKMGLLFLSYSHGDCRQ